MSEDRLGEPANEPVELVMLGDAATMTTGGSGSSTEQKRYPYG